MPLNLLRLFLSLESRIFRLYGYLWYEKTSKDTENFIFDKKFGICLFPTILRTHKWPPQIKKYGQKWQILPKSSKINKKWFFFKFLPQISRVPPKVPWVWFLRLYNLFWQNYEILNKNCFPKEKKSKHFGKKQK